MKKISLLSLLALLVSGFAFGQLGTTSATYDMGDIESDKDFTWYSGTQSSDCPGQLTVNIPVDATILGVDVAYDMTSDENSAVYRQRSHFRCVSPGGTVEATMTNGPSIYDPGTASYERLGLDLANGVVGGGDILFELHAGATHYTDYCSTDSVKVDNNTWTVTITYIPAGYPAMALNPVPESEAGYVGIDGDLTWDFGADTETYDLYFGTDNPPTTKVVEDAVAGATGSYDPGTLDLTTTYYWQVVSKNGNGYTEGEVWQFTTVCGPFETPFTEDFETVTIPELPYCWQSIVNSTSGSATVETSNYYGVGGSQALKFSNSDDQNATLIFVSPEIELNGGSLADKVVNFSMMGFSYPFVSVGTMSDPTDESTYTEYQSFIAYDYIIEHDVYFLDYTGTDTYIAFKLDAYNTYMEAHIDEITIDNLPSCIKPIDIFADNLTINSATLNWTDLNGASAWNIEYGPAGFVPTGTPTISGVTNPYELTGLDASTEYDFYVQTDCGGGDVSAWAGPETFMTPCDYFEVPFSENFDASLDIPVCWTSIVQTGDGWTINGVQSFNGVDFSNCYQMDNGWDQNSTLILALPPVNDLSGKMVRFWVKNNLGNYTLEVGTMTDPTDQNTYTMLTTVNTTTTYQEFEVWLNAYTGTDEYIALKHSNGSSYLQVYLDDISVDVLPSCLPPAGLYVDNITETGAQFYWTETGASTDWVVEVGESGFTPGTETYLNQYTQNDPNGGEQSVMLDGLTAGMAYDVYVMADCGGGDMSDWSGPASFLTTFPMVSLPFAEDFESGMGMTGNSPDNNQNWMISTDFYVSGTQSVHNAYASNAENTLYVLGTFDFTAKADLMLTFQHMAFSDDNSDHCYVEISTDGGTTFDQLPESSYFGAGYYREEGLYNNPEGPCFDILSYDEWLDAGGVPANNLWKKEYFNLSDYSTYEDVQIRFRLVANDWVEGAGWYIDDIAIETIGTPEFGVDPMAVETTVSPADPLVSMDLNLENTGTFPLSYTAQVVYDETELIDENFDAGIPETWTIVKNGTSEFTWDDTTGIYGKSFDGTRFAFADGLQGYAPVTNTMYDDLISPAVDASAYANGTLLLEFDMVFDADWQAGDTARAYVYDGADWVMVYESWTDDGSFYNSPAYKSYDVAAYANTEFKVRFNYIEGPDSRGKYFAIDNVKLRASMSALNWLSLGGEVAVDGVIVPSEIMALSVDMDATGLPLGTYDADIEITSSDPDHAALTVPVTMMVACPSPWDVMVTGSVHTINVPVSANANVNGMPLQEGDWVGVFYTDDNGNMVCGGAAQVDANGNAIVSAYGDDITTTEKDGFADGEEFFWMMYVCTEGMEYTALATYDMQMPDQGMFADLGLSQLTSLVDMLYQNYMFTEGWNSISAYVVPTDAAVENLYAPMLNELIITRNLTDIYWPSQGVNTIGDFDNYSGYALKVSADVDFEITGEEMAGNAITLEAGWHYLPVLSDCGVDAMDLFGSILDDIVIVQDLIGTGIFWPDMEIYTLENLVPGLAYKIKVENPVTIEYPECMAKAAGPVLARVNSAVTNWGTLEMTPLSQVVAIDESAMANFEQGDVIGAFGENNKLYGYMTIGNLKAAAAMTLFGDDYTGNANGFTDGEAVTYEFYRSSTGEIFTLDVEYDQTFDNNTGLFINGSFASVKAVTLGTTGLGDLSSANINIYPNPATTTLTIEMSQIENDISVLLLDVSGRILLQTSVVGKTDLDVSTFEPGVYFLEINTGTSVETQKVIIK